MDIEVSAERPAAADTPRRGGDHLESVDPGVGRAHFVYSLNSTRTEVLFLEGLVSTMTRHEIIAAEKG
jgi:hypothetical protein